MECISVIFHPGRESGSVIVKGRPGWPANVPERLPWELRKDQYVGAFGVPHSKQIQDFIKSKM